MKKRQKIFIPIFLVCLLAAGVYYALFAPVPKKEYGFSMGSPVSVEAQLRGSKKNDICSKAIEEMQRLDKIISVKDSSAELFAVNSSGSGEVSPELDSYINQCREITQSTCGAFDITLGALTSLWNFDNGAFAVPESADIEKALATVGNEKIHLSGGNIALESGTKLDLGAAGKGLACTNAMKTLKNGGVKNAVVTSGGSVGVMGKEEEIGVRNPNMGVNDSFATVEYSNAVASTSGIYEKYFTVGNETYHHILNTKTGFPVKNDLLSVTVICPDGLASDALATACFALGYDLSESVLEKYGAMGIFLYSGNIVRTYNNIYSFKITDSDFTYEKQAID